MGIFNIVVDIDKKEVTAENRRHEKEKFPDIAISLNAVDERPYKKIVSPIASTINDKGELVVDDKVTPIDIVKTEAKVDEVIP